jgi:hypothetical protein
MNDLRHVADWPDMHWNVAGFVCARQLYAVAYWSDGFGLSY